MITVYVYMCGDIIHKGHLLALRNAAAIGDFLIVGVLTDEAIMEKKPKPIFPFDERLALVQELRMVNIAVPQAQYNPWINVRWIRPDILMESISHDIKDIAISRRVMKELNGKVMILGDNIPNCSSTYTKERINASRQSKKIDS